jgi:hypothetical protein
MCSGVIETRGILQLASMALGWMAIALYFLWMSVVKGKQLARVLEAGSDTFQMENSCSRTPAFLGGVEEMVGSIKIISRGLGVGPQGCLA